MAHVLACERLRAELGANNAAAAAAAAAIVVVLVVVTGILVVQRRRLDRPQQQATRQVADRHAHLLAARDVDDERPPRHRRRRQRARPTRLDLALHARAQRVLDGHGRLDLDNLGRVARQRDVEDETRGGRRAGARLGQLAKVGAHLVDGERASFAPIGQLYLENEYFMKNITNKPYEAVNKNLFFF